MNTPIAFLVFNRPECTARTLEAIRAARPPKLFIVADGPRSNRPEDAEKCADVRRLLDSGIDWPCKVERDYSEKNLGCAERVASGLTWAFSRSERLVVVEDDCLPDPSFFRLCDELLERYADDTRIGQICACSRYSALIDRPTSYIFSRYGPIWGWASWRRAWDSYSLRLDSWPKFRSSGGLDAVVQSVEERELRTALYQKLHDEPPDTWDFQWGYAKLSQGMLSVIPCRNLVENIGFSSGGAHVAAGSEFSLERMKMDFPLVHPEFVLPDAAFDQEYSRAFTSGSAVPAWKKVARKLKKGLKPRANALQS